MYAEQFKRQVRRESWTVEQLHRSSHLYGSFTLGWEGGDMADPWLADDTDMKC